MKDINKGIITIGIIAVIVIAMFAFNAGNDQVNDNIITGFDTPFDKQTFNANLETQPTDIITMTFSARISELGPGNLVLDYFPAYIRLDDISDAPSGKNVVGEFASVSDWDNVPVLSTEFETYSVNLPADINNDGFIDWRQGTNKVTMWTLSSYKDHVGKMEIEWIKFTVP